MTRLLILAFISVVGMAPSAMAQSTPASSPPGQGSTPPPTAVEKGSTPAPSAPGQGSTPSKPDPQLHLTDAQRRLDAVATLPLAADAKQNEDARQKLSQLREDFTKLMATYRHRSGLPGHSGSSIPGETPDRGFVDWNRQFSDVERDLVVILGGGSSLSPTSTTAVGTNASGSTGQPTAAECATTTPAGSVEAAQGGAATPAPQVAGGSAPTPATAPDGNNGVVNGASAGAPSAGPIAGGAATPTQAAGSSPTASAGSGAGGTVASGAAGTTVGTDIAAGGVAVTDIGIKNLDPRVRTELEQFRTSIELFYDAATRIGIQ